MRYHYGLCYADTAHTTGTRYFGPACRLAAGSGETAEVDVAVIVPRACSVVAIVGRNSGVALTSTNAIDVTAIKGTVSGGSISWATTSAVLTVDSASSTSVVLKAVEGTDWTAGNADFAAGDLLAVKVVKTGSDAEKLALTLVLECADGQIMFGRLLPGGTIAASSEFGLDNAATGSQKADGFRAAANGRLKYWYGGLLAGTGTWSYDLETTAAWAAYGGAVEKANIFAAFSSVSTASNSTYEYRIGANDVGRSLYLNSVNDSAGTGAVCVTSCVLVPDRPGDGMGCVSYSPTTNVMRSPLWSGSAQTDATATNRAFPYLEGFRVRELSFAGEVAADSGITFVNAVEVTGTDRLDATVPDTVATPLRVVVRGTHDTALAASDLYAAAHFDYTGQTTSPGDVYLAFVVQDRDKFDNPDACDYVDATLNSAKLPGTSETDYTLAVDLKTMPLSWWAAHTTTDETKGTVKDDAGTEIPSDWIGFDATYENGVIMGKRDVPTSGTPGVRIYPPLTGNTARGVSDTYGQYNAYDGNWVDYRPDGGETDRISGRAATAVGGIIIGGADGVMGAATEFDGTDDRVDMDEDGDLDGLNALTLVAWLNGRNGYNATIVSKRSAWSATGIPFEWNFWSSYQPSLRVRGNVISKAGVACSANNIWGHECVSWDGSTIQFYDNGATLGSPVSRSVTIVDNNTKVAIGALPSGSEYFPGLINHLQIHDVDRSTDWISLSYEQTFDNYDFWDQSWTVQTSAASGLSIPVASHYYRQMRSA